MEGVRQQPEIDFLILADRAEAINGKLYLMGGAWDRLTVADFSQPTAFSLAIGVLVPWLATNEEHPLRIVFESADGSPLEPAVDVKVNVGRPPWAVAGQSFRAIIAINGAWKFPGPGSYRATAVLAGEQTKRVVFHVLSAQVAP